MPTAQGTVEIVGNQLVFTPAEDFFGPATFSYATAEGVTEYAAESRALKAYEAKLLQL